MTNTIIRYAKYNFQQGHVDFKLNLKRHQHKFDFWIKDKEEFIMKFCNNYVLRQNVTKDFIGIVVNGHWTRKFNNGNISITAILDED